MSQIIDTARNIMAILQPATGDRSSGPVTLTASGGDVTVPKNTFAMPIVNGTRRADLLLKVGEGPNEDRSWTVTSGGTAVTFVSNIGGIRHNIPINTQISFDPPLSGLISTVPTADSAFTGGTDPTVFGTIKDMVIYEHFEGANFGIDLKRSGIKKFPCVIISWTNTEPADGTTISQTERPTRANATGVLYKDTFNLAIVSSKDQSDHSRRHEGLEIVDTMARLLTDRRGVDNSPVSNPGGIQIRSIIREDGPEDIYQKFYIYDMLLSTERNLQQLDSRVYNDWLLAVVDIYKPQDPALPNQGDITLVNDMEIDMS
jgi:hypothetical protein